MRIHHIALHTRRLDEVEHFYGDLLGLPMMRRHDGSAWLEMSGVLLIVEHPSPDEPDPLLRTKDHVAFEVDQEERERLLERFVREKIPLEEEHELMIALRDPDGRRVELRTYRHRADE